MLHLVQRGGAWAGWGPPSPFFTVPNVTAHPSTASVLITVLLYDGPLLCGFSLAIKGLTMLLHSAGLHPGAFAVGWVISRGISRGLIYWNRITMLIALLLV